ncbi:MAG: glutamate racemase [Clostridia bacterium]|nr:glutamate racemase [Clostridia bacterium]
MHSFDTRPIGVFDSGLGGLTAVKELKNILPNETIVYFGDTGRVPYGTRSNDTIIKYVRQDIRFLLTHGVKAIVAACGTASSVALPQLNDEFGIPLIGVLNPVCQAAVKASKCKKIGVLGTTGTIQSGAYKKGICQIDQTFSVYEKACPMFVPLVENGYIESEATYIIAREYLAPLMEEKVDTIILGCTHYPLLTKVITDIVGDGVFIINAGYETAGYTKTMLSQQGLLTDSPHKGDCRYFVSDDAEKFSYLGGMFLEETIPAGVTKIDIEVF